MVTQDPLLRLQQTMQAISRIATESSGVEALLRRIVDEVMQFTCATGAVVERAEDDVLVYVCTAGTIGGHLGFRIPQQGSLSGLCLRSREPQHCRDSEQDPRVDREACRAVRARSMLLVPLVHADQVVGVLKATSESADAFSVLDEQMLQLCAGIVGAALGRELALEAGERARAKLSLEVATDALTGLANRRSFDAALRRLLDDPQQAAQAALCFIDLNHFKPLNDRFGHEAGDAALRHVAAVLRDVARAGDLVARLAGDEFVILLQELGEAPAERCDWFARKLLSAVEALPLRFAGHHLPLSLSMGLAAWQPGADASSWLARADAAMYQAKRSSQQRFVVDGEAPEVSVVGDRRRLRG